MKFFITSAVYNGLAISVNQEAIKSLFSSGNKNEKITDTALISLRSDREVLMVSAPFHQYYENREYEINDFVMDAGDNLDQLHRLYNPDAETSDISDENPDIDEDNREYNKELIITFVDFFATMAQNRNLTWKRFLDEKITFSALIQQLKSDLDPTVKAAIMRMTNSQYIDQDPRREYVMPALCKIVDRKSMSKRDDTKKKNKVLTLRTNESEIGDHDDEEIDDFKIEVRQQIVEIVRS